MLIACQAIKKRNWWPNIANPALDKLCNLYYNKKINRCECASLFLQLVSFKAWERVRSLFCAFFGVSMEGSGNHRGRSMSGSYTYVGEYPAQNERFGIYGISERKKCPVNISKMGEHEVCIPKPRILV